tara:strand:+ start:4337 stop:4630 length:294 start_codon:yes stop_codon:yes gene_type:complete
LPATRLPSVRFDDELPGCCRYPADIVITSHDRAALMVHPARSDEDQGEVRMRALVVQLHHDVFALLLLLNQLFVDNQCTDTDYLLLPQISPDAMATH